MAVAPGCMAQRLRSVVRTLGRHATAHKRDPILGVDTDHHRFDYRNPDLTVGRPLHDEIGAGTALVVGLFDNEGSGLEGRKPLRRRHITTQ